MSILEILIPTVLFMALVVLRAEGDILYSFMSYTKLILLFSGGESFNPVYKNETKYEKEIYPIYFCKTLAKTVQDEGGYVETLNSCWTSFKFTSIE